ncbi:MAG: CHAT domain-containing tetratricopeptide repeat protein [Cyanobacteria bacterium P01_A01_bin.116]
MTVAGVFSDRTLATLPTPVAQATIKTTESGPSSLDQADRLFRQGLTLYQSNQIREAIEPWQQALHLYRELQNLHREGDVLNNLAAAYLHLENDASAIETAQQALSVTQSIDNVPVQAQVLGYLGRAFLRSERLEEAIQAWQQALALYQQLQNRQGEGETLGNLSTAYLAAEKYSIAMESAQQTLNIAQEINDTSLTIHAMNSLGRSHRALGHYPKAVDLYQQALALAQQSKNAQAEFRTLVLIGNAYESLGDYHGAIAQYQDSLTIAREKDNARMKVLILGNLGSTQANLGEFDEATKSHEESLAIAQAMKDRAGAAFALKNLGVTAHNLGQIQQAVDYYQQSLELVKTIDNSQLQVELFMSLGTVSESLKQYDTAITQYEQGLALSEAIGNPNLEGRLLNNLGHALMESDQLEEAKKRLRQSISLLASLRENLNDDAYHRSLFDTQVYTYNLLQQVLVRQQRYEAALEVSEQGRARAMVSLLSTQQDSLTTTATNDELLPSLSQIKQVARQKNATFVEYTLVPDDAFIVQGKRRGQAERLYIWVVKPTGEVNFQSVDLSQSDLKLADLVKFSRDTMGARHRGPIDRGRIDLVPANRPSQTEQLQRLHQLLIEPIYDWLPTNPDDLVVFIPQDDLFMVPFPALKDRADHYLVQQHTLLTSPSIQVYGLTQPQKSERLAPSEQTEASPESAARSSSTGLSGDDILIVGNPTMPNIWRSPQEPAHQLSDLPGAEQEALTIAQFFEAQPLVGTHATEKALKQQMPTARIIHLATHGLLEYGQPQSTGIRDVPGAIALTPGNGEDGLLTAAEIQSLKLNADLVVLSACDTGLGAITGDGVVGLSRSLITAGTSSVIVSLWAIPDSPTAVLMTEFYRQFQQGEDKAQALRKAMLMTLKAYPDPSDWAAFTLIGEAA